MTIAMSAHLTCTENWAPTDYRLFLDHWRKEAPANDNEIVPRKPKRSEARSRHAELRAFLPAWRVWRYLNTIQGNTPADGIFDAGKVETAADLDFSRLDQDFAFRPRPDEMANLWSNGVVSRLAVAVTRRPTKNHSVPMRVTTLATLPRMSNGHHIEIGGLRFAQGTTGDDDEIVRAGTLVEYRLPSGRWAKPRDDYDWPDSSGCSPGANALWQELLGCTFKYVPSGPARRTKAVSDAAAMAYWNDHPELHGSTPLDQARAAHGLAASTPLPAGLPCGAPQVSDSFLSCRIGASQRARKGAPKLDCFAEAIRSETLARAEMELGDHARTLHIALDAKNLTTIGEELGKTGKTAERTGKRRLLDAIQAFDHFLVKEDL